MDRPVRGSVDARLQRIESRLSRSATEAVGVAVSLPPVAGEVLPDSEVAGTLDLVNDGDQPVTELTAEVTVDGWEPVTVELAELGAGESVQLPVAAQVPADAEPGSHDAALSVSFTVGGDTYTFDDTTTGWVQVTSGIEVGEPDAHLVGEDPAERATIEVPLTNDGTRDVRVSVTAALPSGWAAVPSAEVVVPAGGEATAEVPVAVPVDRIGGPVAVRLDVVRSGSTLASSTTELDLEVPFPPAANVVDHVDFGDATSEQAHALQASPNSGTSVEAGYTRRYSHSAFPGSWYSVELDVPAGEPFVLRGVETFDKAITKKYNVYVDDVLVKTHLVPRTEGGLGIKVYDTVIDHPSLADNDGRVRVRFEFPTDAGGFGDPSLADIWVLPFGADASAPDVSATVVDGTAGDEGWYRSPVRVALSAVDSRDGAPRIEYGEDAGWLEYVGPVTFDAEGEHELSFRATDAAGNRSSVGTLPVRIDRTAPVTEVRVTRGSGVDGSDRATLAFAATDALSGVATTVYRVDGGSWSTVGDGPVTVEGYGDHVVEFASTDVAGNAEPVRRTTVSLSDVESVAAVVQPQVSGTPVLGATLQATPGSWNTKGLDHSFQWLRNGTPIGGATGASYRPVKADLGKRLSVRVTATKAGLEPGEATSAATAPVRKAASSVRVTVSSTQVRPGKQVRVTALVSATGVKVAGKVRVLVDGKTARTLRLKAGKVGQAAKAAVKVRIKGKGKHRIVVRYLGSGTVAPSKSAVTVVRAR
ncbi:NEW3 domain-containing protein [Nocardioides sp. TF02-7]|uniref:OmpL47-type beta-barrel domain-containing protein n=1 Tax=Nocardioides sp. TF02-7 TaxID=2917724 RepID=UPI001F0548DC|nr:NEW3 domain-containing protein [Nocardioides sp. TF02-7]UMG94500.1 NEW3 domain-containing protein [Nocardioides sp. TF02-7]